MIILKNSKKSKSGFKNMSCKLESLCMIKGNFLLLNKSTEHDKVYIGPKDTLSKWKLWIKDYNKKY